MYDSCHCLKIKCAMTENEETKKTEKKKEKKKEKGKKRKMDMDKEAEMETMKKQKWTVMVRGVGNETEWRRVLIEIRDLLRGISRRLDQVEEQLDGIDKRLDRMEGVEEELTEGEILDEETVDRNRNGEMGNRKMDGEDRWTEEDVEMEGER